MQDKGKRAKELFEQGYNCAQAVLLAFDELGLDAKTAAMLSSSFGGGMGRMREVCGAVSGMLMVLGLKYGYDDPKATEQKRRHYARVQLLANEFKRENGSIVCRELLGLDKAEKATPNAEERTREYYRKRPCGELVRTAAELAQKYIEQNG